MDANRPWQFVERIPKSDRIDQSAEICPAVINECNMDLKLGTHLQSTVGGASLVNPGRGSIITVTWNAPTTARRRSFGFSTNS